VETVIDVVGPPVLLTTGLWSNQRAFTVLDGQKTVPTVLSGTDKAHRVFNVAHSPIAVMLFLLEVSFAQNISHGDSRVKAELLC
jgi:hypothetical protein